MGEKPAYKEQRAQNTTTAGVESSPAIVHPTGTIADFTNTIFSPHNETLRRISYWKRARCWLA